MFLLRRTWAGAPRFFVQAGRFSSLVRDCSTSAGGWRRCCSRRRLQAIWRMGRAQDASHSLDRDYSRLLKLPGEDDEAAQESIAGLGVDLTAAIGWMRSQGVNDTGCLQGMFR